MSIRVLILALATASTAFAEMPKDVRVWTQYIEVPHPALSEWLNGAKRSGFEIHAEAVKLAKDGTAKIIETNMVTCRSGQKATIESIREEIFPTEYEPPELPGTPLLPRFDDLVKPRPTTPTAFETKNTGVTLEVEPVMGENESIIDIRLVPEIATPLRLETWMEYVDQWGDASLQRPIYETWRSNTYLKVAAGRFELIALITPKAKMPSPLIPKRILLFVRAELIRVPITQP